VVQIDSLVLRDHLEQLLLERGQISRRPDPACGSLTRDDHLQPILRDLRRILGFSPEFEPRIRRHDHPA
jgi:hypothetical protein